MVPEVSIGVDGPKKCRIWKIHHFETFGPTPTLNNMFSYESKLFTVVNI